ncbi:MAG: DUF1501 domain-containing protein [Myxococcota bacterium]
MKRDRDERTRRSPHVGRRGVLGGLSALGGSVMLRSLATGIPAAVLMDPLSAGADMELPAKTLLIASSRLGDPMNANVPGCYGGPDFDDLYHPLGPEMTPTDIMLGSVATRAAKPWADLDQGVLDRAVFFHHGTYTPVHGEMPRVQRMMDGTERNDMLVSLLSRELAPRLGSVQAEPVTLGANNGGELLSSEGRIIGNVAPLSVRAALGGVDGPLKRLTALRDKHVDAIHALYQRRGTPSQRRLLDRWVRSRQDVREISTGLIGRLEQIDNNGEVNQVRTAAVLAAMNISPVISVHIDFGGDNHVDADLSRERDRHVTGCATIGALMAEIDGLKSEGSLSQGVIFATLNVFGRTLKKKARAGRDHNSAHHCMVMMGDGLEGGIVGGLEKGGKNGEWRATSIDRDSGDGVPGDAGNIPFEETLFSAGKTLGAALGVHRDRLDEMLTSGAVVESVFSST